MVFGLFPFYRVWQGAFVSAVLAAVFMIIAGFYLIFVPRPVDRAGYYATAAHLQASQQAVVHSPYSKALWQDYLFDLQAACVDADQIAAVYKIVQAWPDNRDMKAGLYLRRDLHRLVQEHCHDAG